MQLSTHTYYTLHYLVHKHKNGLRAYGTASVPGHARRVHKNPALGGAWCRQFYTTRACVHMHRCHTHSSPHNIHPNAYTRTHARHRYSIANTGQGARRQRGRAATTTTTAAGTTKGRTNKAFYPYKCHAFAVACTLLFFGASSFCQNLCGFGALISPPSLAAANA